MKIEAVENEEDSEGGTWVEFTESDTETIDTSETAAPSGNSLLPSAGAPPATLNSASKSSQSQPRQALLVRGQYDLESKNRKYYLIIFLALS